MVYFLSLLMAISTGALTAAATSTTRDLKKEYDTAKVHVGGHALEVYVADTNERRRQGLMFVSPMAADSGMLFVFEEEEPLGFWMKNTLISLDIGFFDAQGNLVDIQTMVPEESLLVREPRTYTSRRPALFALEMNRDWFAKNKVKRGAKLTLPKLSKSKLLNQKLPPRP